MHDTTRLFTFAIDFDQRESRLARAGFAIFVLSGGVQALYGAVLPSVRSTFGLSAGTTGWVVGAHYLGSVIGVVLSYSLHKRMSARSRLTAGLVLVGVGALGFAGIGSWPWVLLGILSIGLGYGILVVAVNVLFAAGFAHRSAPLLMLVNACFGAGAVVGPLLYGLLSSGHFRPPFVLAGVLALLIVPLVRAVSEPPTLHEVDEPTRGNPLPLPLFGFAAIFLLYTALETDTSGWMATHMVFHGYSQATAAGFTAAFWTALTVGRLISVPVSMRFSHLHLIVGALLSATVLALAARVTVFIPVAYLLIGLVLAPIFPLTFSWMERALPEVPGRASVALLGSLAGGLIFPVAVGRLMGASTPDALPFALAAIAIGCLCASLVLPRLIQA